MLPFRFRSKHAADVGVLNQVAMKSLPRQFVNGHLKTASSGVFQCRDQVGIGGHQAQSVNPVTGSVRRDVQADPHVDALLHEPRFEVRVGGRRAPPSPP